ncbi:MAG TPA: Lrp/AsnC ligand binding domain-containing protein [Actinomycetaceae bacterium]|mgnify:FL=1|nr:Lrp/AsnC ligand binding domain-containing protein [Actinomycetaceae bacterium]
MLTAIVLIHADVARVPEVAREVAELEGISEVYSVTGDVDLIAVARVARHEDLADVVADRVGKVEGVRNTRTYIAFQAYSKHDLQAAFSIGLGD